MALSNSTRNATASSSDSSLIEPGAIRSDRPVRAPASAGSPHSGPASRGKSTNSTAASGIPCTNRRTARANGCRQPARGRSASEGCAEHLQHDAERRERRQRSQRGEQRLAVEERGHDLEAAEADEQRAVARRPRFEILDPGEHEQERDARVAREEDAAERLPDRDACRHGEERERPRRDPRRLGVRARAVAVQEQQAQHDQHHPEACDPHRDERSLRHLCCEQEHAEPADLRRREHRALATMPDAREELSSH